MPKLIPAAAALFLTLAGCGPPQSDAVSGVACAERRADGAVVNCEPDADRLSEMRRRRRSMDEIDEELPGPQFPGIAQLYSVAHIESNGDIILRSGKVINLAGLTCDEEVLANNLRAVFTRQPRSKLTFMSMTGANRDSNDAYVWEIDTEFGQRHNIEGLGPTIANVNENFLRSGICEPEQQTGHRYHDRYLRIDGLYARGDL